MSAAVTPSWFLPHQWQPLQSGVSLRPVILADHLRQESFDGGYHIPPRPPEPQLYTPGSAIQTEARKPKDPVGEESVTRGLLDSTKLEQQPKPASEHSKHHPNRSVHNPQLTASTFRATKKAIIALKLALAAMQAAPSLSPPEPHPHLEGHWVFQPTGSSQKQPQTVIQIAAPQPFRTKPSYRTKRKLFQKAKTAKSKLRQPSFVAKHVKYTVEV